MTVLVTGAAGFIGSHLCERLLADGDSVVGLDSLTDYYDPAAKRRNLARATADEDFRFVHADLNEVDLAALLEGVETVYHLAGQPGVRASWGRNFDVYVDENIRATQRLLEVAKETSVGRIVFSSSSSIYGDASRYPTHESDTPLPVSPYGVTKLAAEQLCRLYTVAFDVPTVCLRYFSVYGPRQRPDMALARFVDAAIAGRRLKIFGDGGQSRDFTYVTDVVSATVAAATKGETGEVYNIAGGSRVTVLELIAALERALGHAVAVEHLPASPGEPRRTGAHTDAAREALSYQPQMDFDAGVAAQVEAQAAVAELNR